MCKWNIEAPYLNYVVSKNDSSRTLKGGPVETKTIISIACQRLSFLPLCRFMVRRDDKND